MKDIILFGIQGAGKGTQGDLLAEKYGFKKFETGKAFRAMATQETPLGRKVKETVESGKLIPGEMVYEILEDFLSRLNAKEACIFDGVPRNLDQYQQFEKTMRQFQRDFVVVLIDLSEPAAMKRLSERKICPQCKKNYPYFYTQDTCQDCNISLIQRADDQNTEAVRTRIEIFKNDTLPIMHRLETESGQLILVNGEQSIKAVFMELEEKLRRQGVI